jgi:hypothetical protein
MYLHLKCNIKWGIKKNWSYKPTQKWHVLCAVFEKGLLPWHPWLLWLCFHDFVEMSCGTHLLKICWWPFLVFPLNETNNLQNWMSLETWFDHLYNVLNFEKLRSWWDSTHNLIFCSLNMISQDLILCCQLHFFGSQGHCNWIVHGMVE